MSSSKEEYWKKRREEKEFKELFWDWRAECKKRYGAQFIRINKHLFTQRAFKRILDQFETIENTKVAQGEIFQDNKLESETHPSNDTAVTFDLDNEIATTATTK